MGRTPATPLPHGVMTTMDTMAEYRVPAHAGQGLVEAKGSRFYARAVPAADEDAVRAALDAARTEHPTATHHAYAYRLGPDGTTSRYSDDGEPGGTAGRPIMDTLLHAGLVDAVVVVSRVFGGVLLGAGGLVRAYGGAAVAAVRAAGVTVMRPHLRLDIAVSYDLLGAIEQELRRAALHPLDTVYAANVTVAVLVPVEDVPALRARLADITAGRARITMADAPVAATRDSA